MNRLTRVVLAIVAGLIVGGGISYAATQSSNQPSKSHAKSAHLWPVASSLRHRFSTFSHPKSRIHHHGHTAKSSSIAATTPELPASVAASFEEPDQAAGSYYPNAAEAVYEQPTSSAPGFWIVPGKTGACIVWKTTTGWPMPESNCSPLAQVEEHGMTAMSTNSGSELLFGFVPNGTESVTVTNADGSKVSAPVVKNAYMLVDTTNNAESLEAQVTSASGTNTHVWKLPKQ